MTKIASDSEQFAIVTNIGKTKLNQLAAGQRLVITALALGDGNGTSVIPNADGKSLTHEIGREAITDQSSDYLAAGVFMSSAMSAKYQGQWLREVGLIDSEGDLIVWGALASTLVSALSERTIMVHLPLSDVDHITVVVDTAKKFASIDDVSQAMIQHAKKDNPHEQYTTHGELNAAIKSVESKVPHAATHDEVTQSVNDKKFVTPATLNKKGLIQQLQDFATQTANKVKEDIYGGVPAATLDTIKEVADALTQTGDAVKSIFTKLGSLTTAVDSNKNAINNHQASHAAHTPAQVGAAPAVHGHTPEQVGAAPVSHSHNWNSVTDKPSFLSAADKMMTRRWRKTLYEEYTGSSHTSYDSGEVNNDSGCEMMVSIIAWASNHTPRASINVSTGSGSEYCKIASDIIQGTTAMATCVATIPANTTYRIKVVSRITEISTLKYWG